MRKKLLDTRDDIHGNGFQGWVAFLKALKSITYTNCVSHTMLDWDPDSGKMYEAISFPSAASASV